MTSNQFITFCKKVVCNYANERLDKTEGNRVTEDNVYIVWLCKALQNNKALVSTTRLDGIYYEITFNGDNNEGYVNVYEDREFFCVDTSGRRQK